MKTNLNKAASEKTKNTSLSNSYFFQPKLTINAPGDAYEQEADSMADRVMRMPDPAILNQQSFFKPSPLSISRLQRATLMEEEEKKKVHRKCDHCQEEEKLHRKESSNSEVAAGARTESYLSSINTGGTSLPVESRNFFEPRFGYDFSDVKIHNDSHAHESARDVNALAYTHGNNIVFGANQFQPESENGKKLLAHELTHVVQQRVDLSKKEIQRYRVALPSPQPLCGLSLTHIDFESPRWRELVPCVPASISVFRFNLIGRQVSAVTTGKGRIIFNLHAGYYVDPATGKYCAVMSDSERCLIPTLNGCLNLGCFPTLREILDAILDALKILLEVIGFILLAILLILIGGELIEGGGGGFEPAPIPTLAENDSNSQTITT